MSGKNANLFQKAADKVQRGKDTFSSISKTDIPFGSGSKFVKFSSAPAGVPSALLDNFQVRAETSTDVPADISTCIPTGTTYSTSQFSNRSAGRSTSQTDPTRLLAGRQTNTTVTSVQYQRSLSLERFHFIFR